MKNNIMKKDVMKLATYFKPGAASTFEEEPSTGIAAIDERL